MGLDIKIGVGFLNLVMVFDDQINLENDIQSAAFFNEGEVVILTNKGEVLLYNFHTKEHKDLFETNPGKGLQYSDGGFDPSADSSIYTLDNIIVVVNNYKRHGFVLNRKEHSLINLWREEYHADISRYPIALFKNEKDEPHLIFGVDWNQIQIANLTTRQVLTADKSLIEEDAEKKHIDFYKNYEEANKLFWPNEYDYFYGKLMMSPDKTKLLSAGWVWGSADCLNLYDVEDFISNHRIKDVTIGVWEHNNRAACFVDNETIAVLCNPCRDDEEDAVKDAPDDIRLFHADGQGEKCKIALQIPLDLSRAELFYHQMTQCFYTFSKEAGVAVISLNGEIVFHEPSFIPQQYDLCHNRFIRYDKKRLSIFKIE
ncbi:MAG: hypothetical protein FWG14_02900 [Peptococcaceae bacterium]|nr:hypothetical protein [Peptococcaceae bacterium]